MYDTLIERPLTQSQRRCIHAVELTLFLWQAYARRHVAECSFLGCNHQSTHIPSYSLLICSVALVLNVLPRRDEGSGKLCAVIKAS